ncbi:MAG: hypothetical protein ACRELD_07980 [Longimicrobiales bacterium]
MSRMLEPAGLLAALLLAAPLAAQQPSPPGERPAEPRRFSPVSALLEHRAELELSDAQVAQLEAIEREGEARLRPLIERLQTMRESLPERSRMRRQGAEQRDAARERLRGMSEQQRDSLRERMRGVSEQQRDSLRERLRGMSEQMQQQREQRREQLQQRRSQWESLSEVERAELRTQMEARRELMRELQAARRDLLQAVEDVLTEEQRAKLHELRLRRLGERRGGAAGPRR